MAVTYSIYINSATGQERLLNLLDWSTLDYARVENDVGSLDLVLPGYYEADLFPKDGLIEIWRSIDGAEPYLDTDTLWMIRRSRWQFQALRSPTWLIHAVDLNHLLKRRIIDYQPDTVNYTDILAAADDLGKTLVRDNLGLDTLDDTRDISAYLTVQPNLDRAPVRHAQNLSRRNLLKVLQETANWSYQQQVYLVFDITVLRLPGNSDGLQFSFQAYLGQRGDDHRSPGGNPPLMIGANFDNLTDVDDDDDAIDEWTRGIATSGSGSLQAVQRETDNQRASNSPFNLIEMARSTSAEDATALTTEAQALLQSGIPKRGIQGRLVNTSGLVYGLDWKWGDFLTVQGKRGTSDCHASRVHVHVERDSGEQVETILAAEILPPEE